MKKTAIRFVMLSGAVTWLLAISCSKNLSSLAASQADQAKLDLSGKDIKSSFFVPAGGAYDTTPLVFDDFNGHSLDTTAWFPRTGTRTSGSISAINLAANLRVDSSALYIDVKQTGPTTYTCGGVISKGLFGYGYYEARVLIYSNTSGVHQSFWTMGNTPTYLADQDVLPRSNQIIELDGFEAESATQMFQSNIHSYIPSNVATGSQNEGVNATWCNVGFEWLPDQVKWYVNGTLVQTRNLVAPWDVYGPQNVWLTALYFSSTAYPIDPNASMKISYFKFYPNNTLASTVNMLANPSFDYVKTGDVFPLQNPLGWIETSSAGYNPDASVVAYSASSYDGTHLLKHTGTSPYVTTTKQNLTYIANGTYKLTAWVKANAHTTPSRMRVLGYGGSELSVNFNNIGTWTQITIDNIPVTNHSAVVAFTSNANANEWIDVDQVKFIKKF